MTDERLANNGNGLANNMGLCGFPSVFMKCTESPLGETYFFNLVNPLDYDENGMKKAIKKLNVAMRVSMELRPTKPNEESHYSIFINNTESRFVSLYNCLQDINFDKRVVGKDDNGDYVFVDFDKTPHLLVAGTTGSGKSILLHTLLIDLLTTHEGRKLEIIIIDPKGSEFREYKHLNKGGIKIIDSTNEAIKWLKMVEFTMGNRYKQANPMGNHDIFVIVDELADLMMTSKGEVEQSLVRVAQKGRACGMHLIIATQYPKASVLSPLIRANIPARFCLRTATRTESIVVLGKSMAEKLQGKGDCIYQNGLEERHLQVAMPELEFERTIINRGQPKG